MKPKQEFGHLKLSSQGRKIKQSAEYLNKRAFSHLKENVEYYKYSKLRIRLHIVLQSNVSCFKILQ